MLHFRNHNYTFPAILLLVLYVIYKYLFVEWITFSFCCLIHGLHLFSLWGGCTLCNALLFLWGQQPDIYSYVRRNGAAPFCCYLHRHYKYSYLPCTPFWWKGRIMCEVFSVRLIWILTPKGRHKHPLLSYSHAILTYTQVYSWYIPITAIKTLYLFNGIVAIPSHHN